MIRLTRHEHPAILASRIAAEAQGLKLRDPWDYILEQPKYLTPLSGVESRKPLYTEIIYGTFIPREISTRSFLPTFVRKSLPLNNQN